MIDGAETTVEEPMSVLYCAPFGHLSGHPPFESTKETRIMQEHGVDVELLTFCGVHQGFDVDVPENRVMPDNRIFQLLRKRFVTQWMLRVVEYHLTILKAATIAGDRPIYLRDAEPFPHFVHLLNILTHKRWIISSTGGLFTTGEGIGKTYKMLLKMTGVTWRQWYKLSKDKIRYSVQSIQTQNLMKPLLGDDVTVVPLGISSKPKMDKQKARLELGISDNALVLLIFGANHSGKDSKVVYQTIDKMPGVVLIHAGPSNQSAGNKPQELAQHCEAKVCIIDRQIGNDEKAKLFGAADWVVLSYNRNFASTTSMLWEAAAYGVPVIASSGNELERMVQFWKLGLVFRAGDTGDLRLHIAMARSRELRDSHAANCTDFVNFYSEDSWFEKTRELLVGSSSSSLADSTPSRTQDISRI